MDSNNENNNYKYSYSDIDLEELEDLILKSTKEIIEYYEYTDLLKEEEQENDSTKTYKIK